MIPPLRFTPRFLLLVLAPVLALLCIWSVALPAFAQRATPTPAATSADSGADALREAQRLADSGDSPGALAEFNRAVDLYRMAGNRDGEVGAQFYLAMYLRKIGRYAEALSEYQALLSAAAPLHNPLVDAGTWLGIGDSRGLLGQREGALTAYEKAAELYLSQKDANAQRGAVSALNSAGATLHALGRYDEAIAQYQAGLPIAAALGDQRAGMMLEAGLGNAYKAQRQYEKATEAFTRCREFAEKLGDRQWQQMALLGSGGALSSLYRHQEAYADFLAGATIAQERQDVAGEAMLRMDVGLALHDLGRYGEALGELEQALALERAGANQQREALALAQAGATLEALGRNTEALDYYERAQAIAEELQDVALMARIRNDLGLLYDVLGRGAEAAVTLDGALQLAKQLDDPHLVATAQNNLGTVANHQGKYEEAEASYNYALGVFRKEGSASDEAITLNNLAQNYDSQGRYDEARSLYEQALVLHRAIGDTGGEATVRENLAGQDLAQGRYREALESYQAALDVFRDKGMLHQEAVGLSNLATLYTTLGRLDDARRSYDEALGLRRRTGDRPGEGVVLGDLAALDYEHGNYETALDGYRQAEAIATDVGDSSAAATWQNHVAAVLSEMGRNTEAHDAYQEALDRFRQLGDRAGEAAALNGLGVAQLKLSFPEDGLAYLDQAIAIYGDLGETAGQATTLANKAFLLEKVDRAEDALNAYLQSLALREQLRGAAPGEALRLGLTQEAGAVYDAAATLAMRLGRGEEAFSFTERARSRQLLDRLNAGRLDFANGVDSALLQREQALRSEINKLDQGVRDERVKPSAQRNAERAQALNQQLSTRQAEYDSLLTEIKARNPQYAAMVSAEPASLGQIQGLLPPDITLVSYYIGVDASFAFVIGASSFHTVTLQAPAAEVWSQVAAFRNSLTDVNNPYPDALGWLSDRLISPVAPYLKTPVVGFIPHGPTHYLPFAALYWTRADSPRSLIGAKPSAPASLSDRFVLFSLPSVSVLPYLGLEQQARPNSGALVMAYADPAGLPALESANAEAVAVARALGTEPLLGDGASETALRELAPGRVVIHVAAHGQLNRSAPLFSRLYLAPDSTNDGSLEVHEVYGLDLKATDLVTLSACQTDMGVLNVGDDVTGLSRSFFYAGARSVVASLWSVDDTATAALMERFYRNLSAGMGKAQALGAAQASVRNDAGHPEWRHPYYWAGFVLSGDPGESRSVQRTWLAGLIASRWFPGLIAGLLVVLAAISFILIRGLRASRSRPPDQML